MDKTELPDGWRKSTLPPQEPEIQWVSIEKLLDEYTIPVLAAAIEGLDVQIYNATGRRILATDGDESDWHSKAFAISHLAHRYSMLQDPGPDDYLFDERLEIEGSPLDLFGWPKDALPDLDSITPHLSSKIQPSLVQSSSASWIVQAQALAKEYIERNTKKDLHPSLNDTCEYVAKQLRTLKVYGAHQKPLGAGYIKRKALQGIWWKNRLAP